MTGCIHRDTHQTITAETNVLAIKPGLHINCGEATLVLHGDGGWALPAGGRAKTAREAKGFALNMAAAMRGYRNPNKIGGHRWMGMKPSVERYHG